MAMKAFALILCASLFAGAAEPSGPDEKTRVKMAEYMLKTPLNEADPGLVSGFMKLDMEALPVKLRERARAKQMEIDAVVKIHAGKKKGPFRFPAACEVKRYEGAQGLRVMRMILGNAEIEADEEAYVETKANCTESQLICEFSLNVVTIQRKGKPPLKHYFVMETDPLMALVAEKRAGGASTGKYFLELKPSCQKPAGSP